MNSNAQIISNLKKAVYDLQIYTKKEEITLGYSIHNSLVKGEKKNQFYYRGGSEKEITELAKKDPMELFEFLVTKHLEKNEGYGQNPKQFQTPCYLCNQKTLTTLGWSEAGYPNNLERFFCRLCRTSFGWIDIKDDPVELQQEMTNYYLVFTEKDIEKEKSKLDELNEKLDDIHEDLVEKRRLLEKIKSKCITSKKIITI